jgi:hypothetical protein
MQGGMDEEILSTEASRIWVRPSVPNPFESSFERIETPPLTSLKDSRSRDFGDSVATGSFGNLVRKSNRTPDLDPDAWVRQRVRFKLLKIRPDEELTERSNSWDDSTF